MREGSYGVATCRALFNRTAFEYSDSRFFQRVGPTAVAISALMFKPFCKSAQTNHAAPSVKGERAALPVRPISLAGIPRDSELRRIVRQIPLARKVQSQYR
jgi:hypothetical protein